MYMLVIIFSAPTEFVDWLAAYIICGLQDEPFQQLRRVMLSMILFSSLRFKLDR